MYKRQALPPAVAPIQVVIIPIAQHKEGVLEKARELAARLKGLARVKAVSYTHLEGTPTMFTYKIHAENGSMYNTPPTYAIYICKLVLEWIKNDIGGLEAMKVLNEKKASLLYDFLDSSSLFRGTRCV